MEAGRFLDVLGSAFYAGVPDSLLRPLCDCLMERYGTDPRRHVIAANEGNAAALAAGYHLATGKVPVVYLQNSGLGNIVNPAVSLLSERVYGIPAIFVVGWRGEPGLHDEPQHIFQGEITPGLLDTLGIAQFVLERGTSEEAVREAMGSFREALAAGKQVAFVVRKGALEHPKRAYRNGNRMLREEAIRCIVDAAGDDPIVCTTGKASRELFERLC